MPSVELIISLNMAESYLPRASSSRSNSLTSCELIFLPSLMPFVSFVMSISISLGSSPGSPCLNFILNKAGRVELVQFRNLDFGFLCAELSFVISVTLGRVRKCIFESLPCLGAFLQLRVLNRFNQPQHYALVARAQNCQSFVVLLFNRREQSCCRVTSPPGRSRSPSASSS